ncbi:MAG: GNAT family N-acetyltransferase, partial [Candidatus Bipolaricaulia bacterium]
MNVDGLRIERLRTIEQFHACEELQRQAWGMDDADIVALHLLITFEKNGGLVLGAFDDLGEMVGTLFGFLGVSDPLTGKLKHCSHMMG